MLLAQARCYCHGSSGCADGQWFVWSGADAHNLPGEWRQQQDNVLFRGLKNTIGGVWTYHARNHGREIPRAGFENLGFTPAPKVRPTTAPKQSVP